MYGLVYGAYEIPSVTVAAGVQLNSYAKALTTNIAQLNRVGVSQYNSGGMNITAGWTLYSDPIYRVLWSTVLAGQPFRHDPEVVRDGKQTLVQKAQVGDILAAGQWAFDGTYLYVWPATPQATPGPDNPIIVFDWRHGLEEIVLVNTDGTQKGRIAHHHHHVDDPLTDALPAPSESQDGLRVAYTSNMGGGANRVMVVLTTPEA